MAWWCELWEERWPEGIPQMAHVKSAHLARLETQLGIEELSRRMARYLDDDDDWLLHHKHPVGWVHCPDQQLRGARTLSGLLAVSGTARSATRSTVARRYLRSLRLDEGSVGSKA